MASAVRFASAAKILARETRRLGLRSPGFRCPPKLDGVDRSLRRHPGGSSTVAVRLRGRPWVAALADMVEGVIAANRLSGPSADRVRAALWEAVGGDHFADPSRNVA
jgi:hypothetical protein